MALPRSTVTYLDDIPAGQVVGYAYLDVADTKFNPEGDFKFTMALEGEAAQELKATLEHARDEYREECLKEMPGPKAKKTELADVCEDEYDDQENETGRLLFKFKQKAKSGKYTFDIEMWDANGNLMRTKPQVRGGTKIAVKAQIAPYFMESTKKFGVSLRFQKVQIIELVSGGGGAGGGFGAVEGGFDGSDYMEAPAEKPEESTFDDTLPDGEEDPNF